MKQTIVLYDSCTQALGHWRAVCRNDDILMETVPFFNSKTLAAFNNGDIDWLYISARPEKLQGFRFTMSKDGVDVVNLSDARNEVTLLLKTRFSQGIVPEVEPRNQGKQWTEQQERYLEKLLRERARMSVICTELGRSEYAIICKLSQLYFEKESIIMNALEDKKSVQQEIVNGISYVNPTEPADVPFLTTVTLLKGRRIEHYTKAEIFNLIANEEARVVALEAIKNKPAALKAEIEEINFNLQALVNYLDKLDEAK